MSRRLLLVVLSLGAALFIALFAVALALAWFVGTPGGLRAAAGLAERFVPGLRIERPDGRLMGPLRVERLVLAAPQRDIAVDGLELDWRPARLLDGLVSVDRLAATRVEIRPRGETEPEPPADLRLPFALRVDDLRVDRIVVGNFPALEDVAARIIADRDGYRVDDLRFSARGIAVAAQGTLGAQPPFALHADARLSGREGLAAALAARGSLEELALDVSSAHRGTTLEGRALLHPFAAQPLRSATLKARGLDPAAWLDDAPQARLDIDARVAPDAAGRLRGTASALNRAPGRLDAGRLPIVSADADVRMENGNAAGIDRLDVKFARGRASGSGRIDAAGRFTFAGRVRDLDPAAFADLPPGRIDAELKASGRARPQAALDLRFVVRDSRFAGHAVAGRGQVALEPDRLAVDAQLRAGDNRIVARGGLGGPGRELSLRIDAPRLDQLGLSGALHGEAVARGRLAAPALRVAATAHIAAGDIEFAAAGSIAAAAWRGRLERFVVRGPRSFHLAAPAPLRVAREGFSLRDATLLGEDWRARVDALDWRPGHLRSRGSLDAFPASLLSPALRGTLRLGGAWDFDLGRREGHARLFRQRGDLIVEAGGETFPLGLGDALAQAQLRGRQLELSLRADATRAGTLDGRLDATLENGDGALRLARRAPWRGRIVLDAPSIAWLSAFAGGELLLDGRLRAVADIAGTPAQPQVAGTIAGDGLRVRLPEYGLDLGAGVLRAEATRDRLILRRLELTSVATQRPRDSRIPFDARPGQLTATGIVGFDGTAGIDLAADRLLVSELPDRWIMVSGDGRLALADERLRVSAALKVDAAYVEGAPAGRPTLSPDVVIVGRREPEPRLAYVDVADVTIALGQHFRFNGSGIESRLAGQVRLSGSARDLRATGSVRTVDGTLTAYGRELAIERGILNFTGLADNPGLNVRALRRNQAVEAGVEVSGTLKDPEIRLVSVPDVPDTEKLSWLALGRPPGEALGTQDAGALLSAAMALRGGGTREGLLRELGIEEFSIGAGTVGAGSRFAPTHIAGSFEPGGAAGQIATFGRRIAGNAVLSYQRSLASAENVLTLTLELGRRLSLVGSVGTDNAVDLVYSFAFGGARSGDAMR